MPQPVSSTELAKPKSDWVRKWSNLKGQLSRAKETGAEIGRRVMVSGIAFASFGGLYYWRKRRSLAGKMNTLDKAGKVDGFFWPGFALAAVSATPLLGEAGTYTGPIGVSAMQVGSTDYIDKLAQEHHDKAGNGG